MTAGPCVCNQTEHSWLWCPRRRPETTTMTTLDAGEAYELMVMAFEEGRWAIACGLARKLRDHAMSGPRPRFPPERLAVVLEVEREALRRHGAGLTGSEATR